MGEYLQHTPRSSLSDALRSKAPGSASRAALARSQYCGLAGLCCGLGKYTGLALPGLDAEYCGLWIDGEYAGLDLLGVECGE